VIFSTLIPDTAACSFGGDSWLMVLDAINGARLDFAPLDVTNDGTIDQSDLLALDLDGDGTDEYYEPSGKGYSDKIVEFSEQGFLDDGGSVTEKAYGSSSTGEIEDETFGRRAGFFGRQSWFQVSPPVDD
jgi:type IV pilus assembly protein PilY1